ncbi:MAG: O-antigen ligase family protein [Smithella sp.]
MLNESKSYSPILNWGSEKASKYRIIVGMSLIAVFYFSYMPFHYILAIIGAQKETMFIILVLSNLALIFFIELYKTCNWHTSLLKDNAIVLFLYMLFATYTLLNYSIIGSPSNDLFTIRTLIFINPVFAVFATLCRSNKKDVIKVTTLLSSIYFIFLILSMMKGHVVLGRSDFQSIFIGMDDVDNSYQNINMYIGLFVISTLYFLSKGPIFYKVASFALILISCIGMFLVGGRASVVALAVVLLIYLLNLKGPGNQHHNSSNRSMLLIAIIIITLLLSLFWSEIVRFFEETTTARRFLVLLEGNDSSERIYLFTNAINLFLTNGQTILFGAGINSFPVYIGVDGAGMYPHNVVLELLCEYGIAGSILFMLPVVYILCNRIRKIGSLYGNCPEENIIFLFFIYFWIINLFTSGLRTSWILIYFSFLLLPAKIQNPDPKRLSYYLS